MNIRCILTDIEGTTTSVSFVYDTLFPYFVAHIHTLLSMRAEPEVRNAFDTLRTQHSLSSDEAVIDLLKRWVAEYRKDTKLKRLQGVIWKNAYESGEIKGHVYADVAPQLRAWHAENMTLAVYSSGSVAAQQLLFRHSCDGDLSPYFSAYFDTRVGHKRDAQSYQHICEALNMSAAQILFLSDVTEELDAAQSSGMHTLQLVRPGTQAGTHHPIAHDFATITLSSLSTTRSRRQK